MACLTKLEMAVDVETFSSRDIKLGAHAYAEAPDFRMLLVSYKFSNEDTVRTIDVGDGPHALDADFVNALRDPHVIKTAWNAAFERTTLRRWLKLEMPPQEWRDTMILAVQIGLPRALKDVGAALGLPEDLQKLKTGNALINYFCKPCRPTAANGQRTVNLPHHSPERWELFKEYNRQDVVTEQEILRRLRGWAPNEDETSLWELDQEINDRGVRIDVDMARKIVAFDAERTAELLTEARDLTGLDNPNSLTQLKSWLTKRHADVTTLTKSDVQELIDTTPDPVVRRVLEIRQHTGLSSIKKYQAAIDITNADGYARGLMQFYGGHTGRWAGRGLQPQNLVRNTMPDAELDAARELVAAGEFEGLEMVFGEPAPILSQLVRTVFRPSKGRRFVVSDFAAIEARVLAWVAGEKWRLDVFKNGGDIYCESASRIYRVPVSKHGENAHLRQRGKVAELALGYGGAVGAMRAMDASGSIDEDDMATIVREWRQASPNIVKLWRELEDAAICVITGAQNVRKVRGLRLRCAFIDGKKVLLIKLPAGREIAYWGAGTEEGQFGPRVMYMAQNQTTRKWERCETYGGKLTENVVQSIARDCLASKMMQLHAQGFEIAFHVHDEIVLDVPATQQDAAGIVDRIMGEPLDWAPGLPLKGGTYECEFYRKD